MEEIHGTGAVQTRDQVLLLLWLHLLTYLNSSDFTDVTTSYPAIENMYSVYLYMDVRLHVHIYIEVFACIHMYCSRLSSLVQSLRKCPGNQRGESTPLHIM